MGYRKYEYPRINSWGFTFAPQEFILESGYFEQPMNSIRGRLVSNQTSVQKAQISKLENGSTNVTIATILKIFDALKTKIKLHIELSDIGVV